MPSPRWRKVLNDIWSNKTRTLLVVLSVAVGVFAIGVVGASESILFRDLTESYMAAQPASATLFTEAFDEDQVQAVRDMPEVAWAEGRRIINVRVKVGPDEWNDLQLIAVYDFDDIRINKIRPQRGAWPPADEELLVERASLDTVKADVGDTLTIELPSKKLRQMRLVGVVHDITQPLATFTGRGSAYVTFGTLEWLGEPRDFDRLDFTVAQKPLDEEHIKDVLGLVRDKIEKSGREVFFTRIPIPGQHPSQRFVEPMLLLLGVLGVLSLFLSGFLVINTISALLLQQVRQIGLMKAIGGKQLDITIMYLAMGGIFGVLALIIGIPLSVLGARFFTQFMASFINFDIVNYDVPLWVFVAQAAIGLVAPFLAALYPVIRGTRVSVREAITDYGLGGGQFGKGLIDRLLSRVRRLSRPQQISLRNTFRRKARLSLTLVTLILAGGMFISVISLQTSIDYTFEQSFRFEKHNVELNLERPYRLDQIEREALRVPGVTAVESWGSLATRRQRPDGNSSDSIILVAPPAGTAMFEPELVEGRWLLPGDENAVVVSTELIRVEPDVKLGSQIIFEIEGRETTWQVVGIVEGVFFAPATAYANYDYFAQVVREVGRARTLRVTTRLQSAAFETDIASALEGHFAGLGLNVSSVESVSERQTRGRAGANILIVFMVIMAMLQAFVGGLGLMGTMSINVIERTREIGVMRAVGASDGAILRIVVFEGILIGLVSWAIAALIAVPLSKFLVDGVGVAFGGFPFSFVFAPLGVVVWLGIVMVLAALSSFLPAWNASRLTVREVLAYE